MADVDLLVQRPDAMVFWWEEEVRGGGGVARVESVKMHTHLLVIVDGLSSVRINVSTAQMK